MTDEKGHIVHADSITTENIITIDAQRSITVAQHVGGAVTMAVEDPHTVAVVEIPREQLLELTALLALTWKEGE